MNYKVKTIEKILNRKYQTIKVYLDRPEFKHIYTDEIKNEKYFMNITKEDIDILKEMFDKRIKRGKWESKKK